MFQDSAQIVFDHDNLVETFPRGHPSFLVSVVTAATIIQLKLTIQLSIYFKIKIDI